MRKQINNQLGLDSSCISEIEFDLNSRHEIVPILLALQHIYSQPRRLDKILELVEADVVDNSQKDKGTPGMDCWEIIVVAAVRLGSDLDYDALVDLANNHRKLQQMMQIGDWEEKTFARSTVNNNTRKLKPETLRAISELIVDAGHKLAPNAITNVRGDSFVVQTNIAYPIDTRLVFAGVRKVLQCLNKLDRFFGTTPWRQYQHHTRQAKKQLRRIEKAFRSKKATAKEKVKQEVDAYLHQVRRLLLKSFETVEVINPNLRKDNKLVNDLINSIYYYLLVSQYLCELVERRVILNEQIPHQDKLFSIFEPHTELINRGKTPLPIEYGHRLLVIEDKKGFIVDYEIMGHGVTDEKILIEVMTRLQQRMKNRIKSASWDKGFYTPKNVKELAALVEVACLPKKGKLSAEAKQRQSVREFVTARKKHPGIESAIHALVAGNGLNVCRDKGKDGYDRYVGLAIVGRNLHTLGILLLNKARKKQEILRKAA
ncbi:ISNCY family transposase [candidate division KSB1 bacterium]|nr:ISNCY family transposase [candidate division KSB1 bacterium]MBL7093356.1 ISNCY family transposase [candidate division KSB1 bacterium]